MKIKILSILFPLCMIQLFVSGQIKVEGSKNAFLFTEHLNNRVAICNAEGEIVWEFKCEHPQSACMLPDGKRILTSSKDQAMLINIKDKKVLWNYKIETPYEIPYVQYLSNGHIIVGVEGKNTFYEFNKKGELVHETKVVIQAPQVHGTFRFVQRTKENTYIIPVTCENQFREVDLSGKIVRVFKYNKGTAISELRLANGNTILGAGASGEIVEVDKNDNVVWKVSNDNFSDFKINFVVGMDLIGDVLFVANYGILEKASRALPQFFAIDRKTKKVVWRAWSKDIGNVAQIQVLNSKLRPVSKFK